MGLFNCTLIIFILCVNCVASQSGNNLVINAGFEFIYPGSLREAVNTNYLASYEFYDFNNKILGWSSPLSNNPEIMYSKGVFTNDTIYHQFEAPYSGNVSVGLQIAAPAGDDPYFHAVDYVTFAQGTLAEELKVGQHYYFEIKIKRKENFNSDSKHLRFRLPYQGSDTFHVSRLVASNNFGLYLLEEPIDPTSSPEKVKALQSLSPVFNYCSLISEHGEWETLKGWFVCNKKAKWFLLGNFFSADLTYLNVESSARKYHYIKTGRRKIPEERVAIYYIDDVVITEVNNNEEEKGLVNHNCSLNQAIEDLSRRIYFPNGSYLFDEFSQGVIDTLSDILQKYTYIKLHLIGSADTIGNNKLNLKLSLDRAKQVRKAIVQKGIDSVNIFIHGIGEIDDSPHLIENRRVKIIPDSRFEVLNKLKPVFNSNKIYSLPTKELRSEEACFTGQYNLACLDEPIGSCNGFPVENVNKTLGEGYGAVDAIKFLDSASRHYSIIYLSEAHTIVHHRLFLLSLLGKLYKNGYTQLLLESVSAEDSSLTTTGYPTISTGYYTREPFFSELLRSATSIGYSIKSFSPDAYGLGASKNHVEKILRSELYKRDENPGKFLDPDGREMQLSEGEIILSVTEYEMAAKLNNYLQEAGKDKVIIFGGEGHNYKESCGRHIRAGDFLKNYFKTDFLSVVHHSYTDCTLNKILQFGTNVLVKNNKNALPEGGYCPFNNIGSQYDVEVLSYYDTSEIFPWKYIQKLDLKYKPYELAVPANLRTTKMLLIVYYNHEQPFHAIPAHIAVIQQGQSTATVWLKPGDYKYYLRDNNRVYHSGSISAGKEGNSN